MKKKLLGLMAIVMCFAACKKEAAQNDPNPENRESYPVQFNVSTFTQELEDMGRRKEGAPDILKTTGDSLKEHVNYIVYKVFDAQTQAAVKTIFQRSGANASFGQIQDTLPTGSYLITVTAAKDSVMPFVAADNAFLDMLPSTDIFYKRMQLNITGAVSQSVVLDRIVSKVTVTIKDQIPYNARSFSYSPSLGFYDGIPAYFQYISGITTPGSGYTYVYGTTPINIPDSLRGTMNYQFAFYVINKDTLRTTLHLKCMESGGAVIASKDVLVLLVKNKNTVVRGSLFPPTGSGTAIGVNPDWMADSIHVDF